MPELSLLPILKKVPIFADLSEAEHNVIIKNIILNYYPTSHVFFREGESGEGGMYIIKHGMVKISRKNGGDSEREVAVLNDNDFFGEMALVMNEPRNATATAVSECEVFELRKDDFIKLMESSPVMANKITTEFIQREKNNRPSEARLSK